MVARHFTLRSTRVQAKAREAAGIPASECAKPLPRTQKTIWGDLEFVDVRDLFLEWAQDELQTPVTCNICCIALTQQLQTEKKIVVLFPSQDAPSLKFTPYIMAIESAVPLDEGDGTVESAMETPNATIDDFFPTQSGRNQRMRMRANLFLLWVSIVNLGSSILLASGMWHNILWQQLVGGACWISAFVSTSGPGIPWEAREASPLRQLIVVVKMGVLLLGSAFINVLFAVLAVRMGDPGSGYYWWVALVLLCLQFFAGLQITRVGTRSWWIWFVAMAVYSFGLSSFHVGYYGLCFLVASRLHNGFAWVFLIVSCIPMTFILQDWFFPQFISDKQVEWQDHIHVYQSTGIGRFQYIIRPDCGFVPTTRLLKFNPYAITTESAAALDSDDNERAKMRVRNLFLDLASDL